MNKTARILLLSLLITVMGCGCSQWEYHHPYCPNTYSKIFLWRPIHIIINSSVPSQYDQCIYNAANDWNTQTGKSLYTFGNRDDVSIFWNLTWSAPTNIEAYTQGWFHTDAYTYAEIHMDAANYNFSTDVPGGGQIDCESVMLHELGHALGLAHIYDQPSVMNPYLNYGQVRRNLYQIDKDDINCLYGPGN